MKNNLYKMMRGGIVSVVSFAAAFMVACSSSDDKGVAGGTSEDAGIIADLNVAGVAQKGPFVKGSAVTVQGIDCKTMERTGERFEGSVINDDGEYVVEDVNLSVACALLEVTGYYLNENTGKKSTGEISIHAIADLSDRKNVNINMLTELEYERVMHLVIVGGKKFADAKELAEKEVLAAFGIAGDFDNSEDLTIFESGDGNAALLAVSVLMQAETDDAGLAKRIEKFADSFAETGKWNDDKTKATIEKWQVAATTDGTLDSIRKNVEGWGYADVVPAFEKYVEVFGNDVVPASSGNLPSSSSSTEGRGSSSSRVDPYLNPNVDYGEMTDSRDGQVYKTVKIGDQVWMAENLNFETAASSCYNDSSKYCDKYGRLYTWAAAVGKSEEECGLGKECNLSSGNVRGVCPDGWYLPSEADYATLIEAVGGEKGAGTKLKSTSGWNDDDGESGNGTDAFGFSALAAGISNAGYYGMGYTTSFWGSTECGSEGVPETGNGCAYAMWLDYDDVNVNLRSYAAKDLGYSVRCVKLDNGTDPESSSSEVSSPSSSSIALATPCKTETEDNCEYGTLTDFRDGQTYKTVKIGDMVWMAENLNIAAPNSYCYHDSAEYCSKYGRLYNWAGAMDAEGKWSTNSVNCRYTGECSPTYPVRGACPEGWHLPDSTEWGKLLTAVGGLDVAAKMLKSTSGWQDCEEENCNGTDAYGFSALPAGYMDRYGSAFTYYEGVSTGFYTSTQVDKNDAYRVYLYRNNVVNFTSDIKADGFSVRCVKD